jgi:DNA-binding NarL/FixJ family response regulator
LSLSRKKSILLGNPQQVQKMCWARVVASKGVIDQTDSKPGRHSNCKAQRMINVTLADHEKIFRIGMASALSAEDDMRIVGQPSNSSQLVHSVEKFRPHVLILSSAYLGCLNVIRKTCKRQNTAMLLLQDYGATALPAVSADFEGVIRRSADQKTMVECVRHLARGGRVIRLTRPVVQEPPPDTIGLRVRERLSQQELGIVSHVVRGYRNREIALRLGTSEQAVKNALRRIFDKTGVYGRLELALFVVHHRTLAAASSMAPRANNVLSMADLQRHWDSGKRIVVH